MNPILNLLNNQNNNVNNVINNINKIKEMYPELAELKPGNAKEVFYKLCNSRGIDPNIILGQLQGK